MSNNPVRRKIKRFDMIFGAAFLLLVALLLIFQASENRYRQQWETVVNETPQPEVLPSQLEQLAQEVVSSVILRYHDQNEAALREAIRSLHDAFDNYEKGIPAFIQDVTSISVQAQLISGQTVDWFDRFWHQKDSRRVAEIVQKRFETQ